MRILHTSDWHLGRTFHGTSLLPDQAEAIDRMVELVVEHQVELVVIAGDLYDRAIPPAEAITLFDAALGRFHDTGAAIVAISGNHDSAIRVSSYDPLLSRLGLTIRGDVRRAHEPVMVQSTDGGPPVAVYPLPYLDPVLAAPLLRDGAEDSADDEDAPRRLTHDAVTRLAAAKIHADLATRDGARSVVVAHAFVAGGTVCESERNLTIGGVAEVGADAFAEFDYVALGHLHGSQECDGPRVAYSGTPLPYSFSEQDHVKSVRIVDLAPDGSVEVSVVPLGAGRPLCTITGELESLLEDPELAHAVEARVRVFLTDEYLPMQAMARVQTRFPHAAELQHRPVRDESEITEQGRWLEPDEVVAPIDRVQQFWADQQQRDATEDELALLTDALEAATTRSGQ